MSGLLCNLHFHVICSMSTPVQVELLELSYMKTTLGTISLNYMAGGAIV